jgi:D-amino peptidase
MTNLHAGPVARAAALVLAAVAHPALAHAQAGPELRVFISADMEGITGVVNGAQLAPGEFEYERFRTLMTGEVNAAIEGALAAGATKVTVADSHGNGLNLLVEALNPKARLIRSWPRPLEMMEGVEGGFDAAMFIGYHASINTPQAVRAHSISSRRFYDLRLNGRHASEGMLNAAIAGHFGVPVVFASGDEATLAELRGSLGAGLAGVAVKRAIGYHSADSLAPEVARERIRAESERALRQRAAAKPFVIAGPVRLEISFKSMINAEVLALLPVVERVDGATVAFTGKDVVEAVKFIAFATQYDSTQ